jgi:hypothetical protein
VVSRDVTNEAQLLITMLKDVEEQGGNITAIQLVNLLRGKTVKSY